MGVDGDLLSVTFPLWFFMEVQRRIIPDLCHTQKLREGPGARHTPETVCLRIPARSFLYGFFIFSLNMHGFLLLIHW